jgi:hypothetical protein
MRIKYRIGLIIIAHSAKVPTRPLLSLPPINFQLSVPHVRICNELVVHLFILTNQLETRNSIRRASTCCQFTRSFITVDPSNQSMKENVIDLRQPPILADHCWSHCSGDFTLLTDQHTINPDVMELRIYDTSGIKADDEEINQ